jgi:hypothetical protein
LEVVVALDPFLTPAVVYTAYRIVRWGSWLKYCTWVTKNHPGKAEQIINASKHTVIIRPPQQGRRRPRAAKRTL